MRNKVILLLLAVVALAAVLPLGSVSAQEGVPPQTITVTGFGTAYAAPDIASLSVGVETMNEDVTVAMDDATNRINDVMAALKAQGIEEADIRTENFYIYRETFYGPEGPTGEGQFRVSNNINVTVRDTEKVPEILSAMLAAGATNVYNVSFNVEDTAALESEARKLAIEDARATAEELAALLGVSVGEVVAVAEYSTPSQPFSGYAYGGGGGGGAAPAPPPIQGGSLAVSISVEVKFELVR